MEDKYIACMILHALGDTIGFKNSEWEFLESATQNNPYEKVNQFIYLGGITGISLKGWIVSDDTVLHIKNAQALTEDFGSINTLCENITTKYLEAFDQFQSEGFTKRFPGKTTLDSMKRLKTGTKWDRMPYNLFNGGSGASMRSLCIGLAFHGESNRDKLYQVAIESSRITHNSTTGYLGGLASALFTALAVEKVPIEKWMFILSDVVELKLGKLINALGRELDNFTKDAHIFMAKIKGYIEMKFDFEKKVVRRRSDANIGIRNQIYFQEFAMETKDGKKISKNQFIGSGGDDSIILAYDCLLDAGSNWEKLIYYAMLHIGDTDTTGCIAGGWYGALYGFKNVPDRLMEHLEYKKELESLGKKLHKKFAKS